MWRLLRGRHRYRPLPVWAGLTISSIVAFSALLRGVDLVTSTPPALTSVREGARPTVNYYLEYLGASTWGTGMLVVAALITLGLALHRPVLLALGHAGGAAVYFGYAIVLAQGLIISHDSGGPLAGLRFLATALAAFALNLVRCVLVLGDVRAGGRGR